MTTINKKVIRLTTLLATILSVLLAVSLPFGYFIMSYERQSAVLETEAQAMASVVSQFISENPEYWRYERPRLLGFVSHRPTDFQDEILRIVDTNGVVLAQSADGLPLPLITRTHPLYDSGTVVAQVEISRSQRSILINALMLGVLGLVFGAGSFFLLRVFPLRAVDQTLKSLQESEDKFRAIATTAADAIIVMNNRGRITYWNPAAVKMFGYTPQEILGRELHALLAPPAFHENYVKGFEHFVRTGTGPAVGTTREFTALRKDGTEFPMEVSTSAVELGGEWNAVGIVRDITERKKTETELVKIEKLESIGVLAGGIAHDFNNLLTVILGNISLAQLDVEYPDKLAPRLGDVEKAVLSARELTQQLLTFAKGGAPIKKTSSIRDIIGESCSFSLSGSNVKCDLSFAEDLMPSDVDAGQISQVMQNLIINAAQAMPEGGAIQVTCSNVVIEAGDPLPLSRGPHIKISIKDEGIGIPKENLSKIFDPYFTTKPRGSGLGLATSYCIIHRHGGFIGVESFPGAGSVFHVYLPASSRQLPVKAARQIMRGGGEGRVLVMDDEDEVRSIAGQMLAALGYEPILVRDGAEALKTYREASQEGRPIDVVIMDLTIPGGMGGKDAVGKLLELDPMARVIVASGYSNDPVMARYRSYGFKGVMAKPFTLDLFSATLSRVMAE
jgi:PAS domain S-box-containing protein